MGIKFNLLAGLVIFALAVSAVSAAEIHGLLYDFNLDEVNDAIVTISTEPRQQMVSKNSTYSFYAPLGEYIISAKKYSGSEIVSSANENITIKSEGDYVLDLVLFPSFDEEQQILDEADFDIDTGLVDEPVNYTAIAVFLIAIAALIVILRMKGKNITERRNEFDEDQKDELRKVIDFIKKEGGRTTQKELRKQFPLSEAKISLMISELENEGKIKKIKKGRGNIIILNK